MSILSERANRPPGKTVNPAAKKFLAAVSASRRVRPGLQRHAQQRSVSVVQEPSEGLQERQQRIGRPVAARPAVHGLRGEHEHRPVAPSGPGRDVDCVDQRVGLLHGQERDQRLAVSFGRDRQDTFDQRRMLGMTASRVAVERADRGQPLVPSPRAARAIVLEVASTPPCQTRESSTIASLLLKRMERRASIKPAGICRPLSQQPTCLQEHRGTVGIRNGSA